MTQIEQAKTALAKKFPGEIYVFPYKGKTAIMHRGLYKGSYNDVMNAPKKDYEIRLGNKRIDTRKAMTSDLFEAALKYWKEQKLDPIPYSYEAKEDGYWLWAIMTGEPLTAGGHVQLRYVDEGRVDSYLSGPGSDDRYLRGCPAVVIDEPLTSDISPSSEPLSSEPNELGPYIEANTEALNNLAEKLERVFKL